MASLMEEFTAVLQEEEKKYRELITLSYEKKDVIIQANVDRLDEITEEEQKITTVLHNLELKRDSVLSDMAIVLNKKKEDLTVEKMISLMEKLPKEQEKLIHLRTSLRATLDEMKKINSQNQMLIQQAIEMTEFDLTLFKSLKQAPETANYNKNAYSTGELLGRSGFDAKQ
jgi:hypothetical protein